MVLIFCLVLHAVNIPSIKKYFFKRKLYVSASNPETTAKTKHVQVKGQIANWNENLDLLQVFPLSFQFYTSKSHFSLLQPSSRLTLRLYAKRSTHPDILLGTREMRIPLVSQSGSFC